VFRTASARVVVRPSGTEPKLKAYLEIVEHGPVPTARKRAADRLSVLGAEVDAALGF
jgi:phosphomannomutase